MDLNLRHIAELAIASSVFEECHAGPAMGFADWRFSRATGKAKQQ
jgi:hypothetical protein